MPAFTKAPIVLVHGVLGFSEIKLPLGACIEFFPGVARYLTSLGNRVETAHLSATAGIAQRAAELKLFIQQTTDREPVHLLAYSMGGLDARYMISKLGMADRVVSLTTIGTPHRGTTFADWSMSRFGRLVKQTFRVFGTSYQAFYDLTVENCARFNLETPDAPNVRYFSVAGRCADDWTKWPWYVSSSIVTKHEGPNDGIVSIQSATYGESLDIWEGDHLTLANWPTPLRKVTPVDRREDYARLVARLANLGL